MSPDNSKQLFLDDYSDDPIWKEYNDEYVRSQSSRSKFLPYLIISIISALLGAATNMIIPFPNTTPSTIPQLNSSYGGRHNITTDRHLLTCGNSTSEARSHNCKYDIFLNNWVPEPCFDDDWVKEYQDDDSWAGFADEELTQRLSVHEMSEREFYWTSLRDHINHCGMIWRKQFWVLFEQSGAIDTVMTNPLHTDHCSQYMMDAVESNRTKPTKTVMGFAGCWIKT